MHGLTQLCIHLHRVRALESTSCCGRFQVGVLLAEVDQDATVVLN